MNRNDFLNMIGSRASVNRSALGEVYELVDLFPYFQSAHMLLLKGLRDNDDVKFEKQLKSSAVHIADREVLYYLLTEETKKLSGELMGKTVVEPVIVAEREPDHEQAIGTVTETQQTVIESAKNSDMLISEIEKDSEYTESEEGDETSIASPAHPLLISTDSYDENATGVMLLMDEDGQDDDGMAFYMDPGFSIPDMSDLLEIDTEATDSEGFVDDSLKEEVSGQRNDKVPKKQLQTELIEKFIIANPRIEPARERIPTEVEDLSKPHVEEKGGFVTETLARIYISQAYYSKAIDIYEKLSLKFPEKSSYFAAQIEKVKEYIKK